MADGSCSATPQPPSLPPVFVNTSLDTHLAIPISPCDTVADLKRKIRIDHALCFPKVGEISILSIKVKRRGSFYYLPDSMLVRSAFDGIKRTWFVHIDAISAIGDGSQIGKAGTIMVMDVGLQENHHIMQKEPNCSSLAMTSLHSLQGFAVNGSAAGNDIILTGNSMVSEKPVLPDALPHSSSITCGDVSIPQTVTDDKKEKKKRKQSAKSHNEVGSTEPSNAIGTDSYLEKEKFNSKTGLSDKMPCMGDIIPPVESPVTNVESAEPLIGNPIPADHPSSKDDSSHYCVEENLSEKKPEEPADVTHAGLKVSCAISLGSTPAELEGEAPSKERHSRKMRRNDLPSSKASKLASLRTLVKAVDEESPEASRNNQNVPSECHAGESFKPSELSKPQTEDSETAHPSEGQCIERSLKETTADQLEDPDKQSNGALDVGKSAALGNLSVTDPGIPSNECGPKSRQSRRKSAKAEFANDVSTIKFDEDYLGKGILKVKSKNTFGNNHECASSDGLTCITITPFGDASMPQIVTDNKKEKKKRKRSAKSHNEVGSTETSNAIGTDSYLKKEKLNSKTGLAYKMQCMADIIPPVESPGTNVESAEPLIGNPISADHLSSKDDSSHYCVEENLAEEKPEEPADVTHADLKLSCAISLGNPAELEGEAPSKVRRSRKMHKNDLPSSKASKLASLRTLVKAVDEENSEEASGNNQNVPSECHAGEDLKPSELSKPQTEDSETAHPSEDRCIEQIKETTADQLEDPGKQSNGALDVGKPAGLGNLSVADPEIPSDECGPKSRRSRRKSAETEFANDMPTSKFDEDYLGKGIPEVKSKDTFGSDHIYLGSESNFSKTLSVETPAEAELIFSSGTRRSRHHKKKSAKTKVLLSSLQTSDLVDHAGSQTTQENISKELGSRKEDSASKTKACDTSSESHAVKNSSDLLIAESEKCEAAHPSGDRGNEQTFTETAANHLEDLASQSKGAFDAEKMTTSGNLSIVGSGVPSREGGPKPHRNRKRSRKAELPVNETTREGNEDVHAQKKSEFKLENIFGSNYVPPNDESKVLEISSLETHAKAESILSPGTRKSRGRKKKSAKMEVAQDAFQNNYLVDPAGNQTTQETFGKEFESRDEDLPSKTKAHILPDESGCIVAHVDLSEVTEELSGKALKDSALETVQNSSEQKVSELIDEASQMKLANPPNDHISFFEFFGPKATKSESVKSAVAESGTSDKEKTNRKRKSSMPVKDFSSGLLHPSGSNEQNMCKKRPLDAIPAIQGLGCSPGWLSLTEDETGEVDNGSTLTRHTTQKQLRVSADSSVETFADIAASSDSTEEDTSDRKRQYRVGVRKIARKRSPNILRDSIAKSIMPSISGSIFNDDTNGSSEEETDIINRKYGIKASADGSSSSPDSKQGKLQVHMASPGVDAAGNGNTDVDGQGSILRQSSKRPRKSMPISKILRSSSSYKKAKLTPSQLEPEDSESQPADVVLETPPELGWP